MPITEYGQFQVNFVGDEANELFLEPVFFDDEITNQFRVMPNVVTKKKMGFVQALENVVRKYSGCGFAPLGEVKAYDRSVEVEKARVDLEICWDEFEDTVYEELLKRGVRLPDITGTLIQEIITLRVQQAIRLDTQRLAYFGNTASNDPNYDLLDGLWSVHYPALVALALVPRTNTGSGAALSSGDGFDILRAVYDQAPLQLKGLPMNQKVINVTGSVYTQFREDVEDGGGGDYGLLRLIDGVEQLTFRGIPVIPQWRWDEILANLNVAQAHYVEYTTPMNKVIATDVANPATELSTWYDEKDEKVYTKSRFKMGVNYIHHSLISVGY
jgi:hypothetical protein